MGGIHADLGPDGLHARRGQDELTLRLSSWGREGFEQSAERVEPLWGACATGGEGPQVMADGDGYGDASSSTDACWAPTGYVSDSNDCDDDDDTVYPTATETTGDGVDSDCDGSGGPDDDDDGLLDGEDDDPLTPAEAGGNGYEGDDPKGCGCASSNPSPVGGLAGLLVVGLALVRRRPTREVLSCRSGPRGATHAAVTGL